MLIISHRGNLEGSNTETENTKAAIMAALEHGFDVEIDVQDAMGPFVYLGHDYIVDKIDLNDFTREHIRRMFFHVKNVFAATKLTGTRIVGAYQFDMFGHDADPFVITRNGYTWIHPNWISNVDQFYQPKSIAVLPKDDCDVKKFHGICVDNPIKWRDS